jgi:hypothetical protein
MLHRRIFLSWPVVSDKAQNQSRPAYLCDRSQIRVDVMAKTQQGDW